MVQKNLHRQLVEKGIEYLKKEGFKNKEIFLEYPIQFKKKGRNYYLYVDVVGKKGDNLVFVECGGVEREKVELLKTLGKVVLIPYKEGKPIFRKKQYIKTISLSKEMIDFIDSRSRNFSLTAFIRKHLERYKDMIEDLEKMKKFKNDK